MGHSQSSILNVVNETISSIFVELATECSNTAATSQIIRIECPVSDVTTTPENSTSCRTCLYSIYADYVGYMQLQLNKWDHLGIGVGASVDKPIEDDFHDLIQKGVNCGLTMCKKCVANELSQNTTISSTFTCEAMNNIDATIDQRLTDKITNQLENKRDLLAPFASLFGGDSSNIVANIVGRISTAVKRYGTSKLVQAIRNSQTINVIGGQRSVNISQSSAFNSVMNQLITNNVTINILSEQEWTVLIKNINDQSTIGALGEALVSGVTLLADLARSLIGIIMIGVIAAMGAILLGVIIYIVAKIVTKKIKENADKKVLIDQNPNQAVGW